MATSQGAGYGHLGLANPALAAPAAPVRGALAYRREIDGLRFWAVVPVILFHAKFAFIRGGFAGVDVFFVISGYLITSILAVEEREGRFSIVRFYERRARRILPALYLVVLAAMLAGWFLLRPLDYADMMDSAASVVVFGSNIYFWRTLNYFAVGNEITPLLHTWSLGVEEQFYVLFPVIFIFASRLGPRRRNAVLMTLLVLSLAYAESKAARPSISAFYLLPMRAWELLIGSFCGLYLLEHGASQNRALNEAGSALGLLLLLAGIFLIGENLPCPSHYTLIPTIGAALIILCATGGTTVQRFLCWPPFVWIGLVSYSAYLWHQPLFAFARYYRVPGPGPLEMLGWVLAVFPLAWLSWRFVEAPFRDRARFSGNQIFALGAVGAALLLGLAIYGHVSGGMPDRSSMRALSPLRFVPDNRGLEQESWAPLRRRAGTDGYSVNSNPFDRQRWFSTGPKLKVLVVGNSHGKDLYNMLGASRRFGAAAEVARYGIQVWEIGSEFFDLPNYRAADVVVICSYYWPDDFIRFDHVAKQILRDGKRLVIVRKVFAFPYEDGAQLADRLVPALYRPGADAERVADAVDRAFWEDFAHGPDRSERAASDRTIDAIVRRYPEIRVMDRMDYLCDRRAARCHVMSAQLEKYLGDYGHYTLAGARYYASLIDKSDWLDPILGTAGPPRNAR